MSEQPKNLTPAVPAPQAAPKAPAIDLVRLSSVVVGPEAERLSTGIPGLDACLAEADGSPGGLPLGTSVLFSGMPGGGKSSIATFMCSGLAKGEALYLHGEERASRVKARWDRFKLTGDPYLMPLGQAEKALHAIREIQPLVSVVDSVQTLSLGGKRRPEHQLEAAEMLVGQGCGSGGSVILVCHVSKSGQDHAGAAGLSHLVDVWIHVTVNAKKGERILEVRKNRVGRAGFGVPLHMGISSVTVGTPAPLSSSQQISALTPVVEAAIEKAWAALDDGKALTGYDCDVAGCMPAPWRLALEMAVKRMTRDGYVIEDFKEKGRRTFRVISKPPGKTVQVPETSPTEPNGPSLDLDGGPTDAKLGVPEMPTDAGTPLPIELD